MIGRPTYGAVGHGVDQVRASAVRIAPGPPQSTCRVARVRPTSSAPSPSPSSAGTWTETSRQYSVRQPSGTAVATTRSGSPPAAPRARRVRPARRPRPVTATAATATAAPAATQRPRRLRGRRSGTGRDGHRGVHLARRGCRGSRAPRRSSSVVVLSHRCPPAQLGPHRGERPVDVGAHGRLGDAEDRGDLGVLEVLVVAQHHRRPLLRRQRAAHPPDRVAGRDADGVVDDLGVAHLRHRQLAATAAPPGRDVRVDDHPAHVGVGVGRTADPRPPLARPGERRLHRVLRGVLRAGHQVGEPQQRGHPRLDPVVEGEVAHGDVLLGHAHVHVRHTPGTAVVLHGS